MNCAFSLTAEVSIVLIACDCTQRNTGCSKKSCKMFNAPKLCNHESLTHVVSPNCSEIVNTRITVSLLQLNILHLAAGKRTTSKTSILANFSRQMMTKNRVYNNKSNTTEFIQEMYEYVTSTFLPKNSSVSYTCNREYFY